MFLFPRREEELQSKTTEFKHREASSALTQPAARPQSLHLSSPSFVNSYLCHISATRKTKIHHVEKNVCRNVTSLKHFCKTSQQARGDGAWFGSFDTDTGL